MRGDRSDILPCLDPSIPADEKGNAHATFIRRAFQTRLVAIEERISRRQILIRLSGTAARHAVVGHEYHHRVFIQVPLLQLRGEQPHILIDVLDHPVKSGLLFSKSQFHESPRIFLRRDERPMRRVRGDVCEKRLTLILAFLHPSHCRLEKYIRAEPARLHESPVVTDDGIHILVVRRIRARGRVRLSDATCTMDKGLVEPALLRLIGLLVSEVPFSKNARGVSRLLQHLREDRGVERHPFTLENRVRDPILQRMTASHDRASRRRACGAHEEPRKTRASVVKRIEIRRLQPRVPMTSHRPVALVIGDHEDDVRLGSRKFGKGRREETQYEKQDGCEAK